MPIYEFKCAQCGRFIEMLLKSSSETVEMKCPDCGAENLERVLSSTSYVMGEGAPASTGVSSQTRSCSGGNCTTWDIPGHSR